MAENRVSVTMPDGSLAEGVDVGIAADGTLVRRDA